MFKIIVERIKILPIVNNAIVADIVTIDNLKVGDTVTVYLAGTNGTLTGNPIGKAIAKANKAVKGTTASASNNIYPRRNNTATKVFHKIVVNQQEQSSNVRKNLFMFKESAQMIDFQSLEHFLSLLGYPEVP